jgi:hypothetical protein
MIQPYRPCHHSLIAKAKDPNDRISKVEFYKWTTVIRTEYYYPYTYTWTNVKAGTYSITAKAYVIKVFRPTSRPVNVNVKNAFNCKQAIFCKQ